MELVILSDLTITTDAEMRASHPTVMFGQVIDKATYLAYGYAPVLESPQPDITPNHVVVRDGVKLDGLGNYVQDWKLVAKTTDQVQNDRATALARITTNITAERDRRKLNGVLVAGKWIPTTLYSRTRWQAWVIKTLLAQDIAPVTWPTMDGATVTVTADLAKAVLAATEQLDLAVLAVAANLTAQVLAAADPTTIDIMVGWPLTFGD